MAAAIAGVAGGFSAKLFITPRDPLLSGLTQAAAQIIDPARDVQPPANYYVMVTLVPIFTLAGWWLTDRVVEPRLAKQTLWLVPGVDSAGADAPAAPVSHRGLWLAGAAALLVVAAAVALAWAPGMPLRADDGSIEPLLHSIVALTFLLFLVSGLVYGVAASTIRSDRDAVAMMNAAMAQMGAY
jgi:aminobenzoyl-glutamate transport protein